MLHLWARRFSSQPIYVGYKLQPPHCCLLQVASSSLLSAKSCCLLTVVCYKLQPPHCCLLPNCSLLTVVCYKLQPPHCCLLHVAALPMWSATSCSLPNALCQTSKISGFSCTTCIFTSKSCTFPQSYLLQLAPSPPPPTLAFG